MSNPGLHTGTHTDTRGHTRTRANTYGHTRIHADTREHTRTNADTRGHTDTHAHTHTNAHRHTHAHARHLYDPYVENIAYVTYILDMVTTRELQFCIGGRPM